MKCNNVKCNKEGTYIRKCKKDKTKQETYCNKCGFREDFPPKK